MKVDRFWGRNELWVGTTDGSGGANSSSFYIFTVASDGTLTLKTKYEKCCGPIVDIVYKE